MGYFMSTFGPSHSAHPPAGHLRIADGKGTSCCCSRRHGGRYLDPVDGWGERQVFRLLAVDSVLTCCVNPSQ